jgi:hypothetical protein
MTIHREKKGEVTLPLIITSVTKKQKGRKSMASATNGAKKEGKAKVLLGKDTTKDPPK